MLYSVCILSKFSSLYQTFDWLSFIIMVASRTPKYTRHITLVLLLGFGWHVVSNHGFIGNLIYCFGPNGDVKVEVYCEAQPFDSSSVDSHSHKSLDVQEGDHLQTGHSDVAVSETCPVLYKPFALGHIPAPKLKLFTRDGISTSLKSALIQISRWSTYRIPAIQQPALSDLRTVVLLN